MLVAILLVAFATILAAAIGFKSAMAARRGTATLALDQSLLVAEAAEALAAYALREDLKGGKNIDFPTEAWGMPLGPVEVVPGITLEAYVEDVSGRFNLNSLITSDGTVDQGALHDLEHLMESVAVEPKWASMIADWIDPDGQPLPDGAEDSAYASQDPPYRAPNTFITSASELLALPGFGRDRYLKLAPFVTALPPGAMINTCSASGVLLDALLGPTNREYGLDPERLAKSRESGCFPTFDEFKASFGADTDGLNRIANRVNQTSNYFRLTSVVTIGSADFNLYSLLQRDNNGGRVHVLMRSFTPD
jgi:general secretion pathway protein K